MVFTKKMTAIFYAIGGLLLVCAGLRDIYLPGYLSISGTKFAGSSTAGFHFALASLLFIMAAVVITKVKE